MEALPVVHVRCGGIDVHKETVVVCVRCNGPAGKVDQQIRTFATTTQGLLELGDWLAAERVAAVAMESTGVYWKPVWNPSQAQGRLCWRAAALGTGN